jgi:iron complex outermembrane receptor protein
MNPLTGTRMQPEEAVLTIGNENLKPSTADTWLAGFLYSPKFVKGLSVGANYYNIQQENIPFESAQYVVNQWWAAGGPNNANNPFGPNAGRSPQNPLGSQVELRSDGEFYQIRNVGPINSGERKTDGIDLLASYSLETDFGTFTLSGQATRVLTFEQENFPGAGTVDYLGKFWGTGAALEEVGFPEWRAVLTLSYEYKRWNGAIAWNFVNGYTEDASLNNFSYPGSADPSEYDPREVRDYNTFDVRLGYKIPWLELDFLAGINNVFDEQPPLVTSTFGDGYDRSVADIRGRMWFINFSKTF